MIVVFSRKLLCYTSLHATVIITAPLPIFFTVEGLPRVPLSSFHQSIACIHIYTQLKDFHLLHLHTHFTLSISLSLLSTLFYPFHQTLLKHSLFHSFYSKMTTSAFDFDGARFVTNNYAAILDNGEALSEFHLIQDFLAHSELMYALTQPESISLAQVLTFWRTANYNDDGEHGSPSLTC